MKKELILTDYIAVAALIKWAHKNKESIEVERLGNDTVGIYYKVTYGSKLRNDTRQLKGNGNKTKTGRSRRKSKG